MTISNKHYRYNHSAKGQARTKRYDLSDKGKMTKANFYAKHGGMRVYQMERYYRIQDEAGYHTKINTFYPGFRILRALANAPMVEI